MNTPLLALALCLPLAAEDAPVRDIRVMSFNIRYGSANDGENAWDRRKGFLIETVRAFGPDLLGTQETLASQRDDLAAGLPEYALLAAGRDDGKERGEMMALFYRKARFERLGGGHFWLSEAPDRPGSKSWDSSLPRMVTWVKLRDLENSDAPPIAFFNTHFDHRGPRARLESSRLILRKVGELAEGCRVILTGDFNSGEGSEPYVALFAPDSAPAISLYDAYRVAHPDRRDGEGTFTNFRAGANDGARIDWIGVSEGLEVKDAAIDRTSRDGHTPSDHFPVTAILRPSPAKGEPRPR